MLAEDLRFPKPKPFRREFIEFMWKEGRGERKRKGQEREEAGEVGLRGGCEDEERGV